MQFIGGPKDGQEVPDYMRSYHNNAGEQPTLTIRFPVIDGQPGACHVYERQNEEFVYRGILGAM